MTAITAAVLAAALSVGAVPPVGAAPAPAADLVVGSTGTAQVAVPYPGHRTTFEVTARAADGAGPSDLALLLDGGTGPLADGPDALILTLADTDGELLTEGTAAQLHGSPIHLGRLGTEPVTVHGTAALPASAGDAVQGVGLTLTLRLVAAQESPATAQGPSGVLALTGTQVFTVAALAAALAAAGLLLIAARRRARRIRQEMS